MRQLEAERGVTISVRVTRRLRRDVRLLCLQDDRLLQDFVSEALTDYLRANRRKAAKTTGTVAR